MSRKISTNEPADRPIQIALSEAELFGLVNYHHAESRRVVRMFGKWCTDPTNRLAPIAMLKSLKTEANRRIQAHSDRAKGLAQILNSRLSTLNQ